MNKKIISITGFHRAGTHPYAREIADKEGLPYIEEKTIGFNNMFLVQALSDGYMPTNKRDKAGNIISVYNKSLDKGFVLQCPMCACFTLRLSEIGSVVWCTRNNLSIINSMKVGEFRKMSWDIVKTFKQEFPDDKLWDRLKFECDSNDIQEICVQYYALTIKIKEYFYNNYFKGKCKKVVLEKQPYYDAKVTQILKRPMTPSKVAIANRVLRGNI